MAREYVFVDEWDVEAPPEAVFEVLGDAGSYPEWWKPVYIDAEVEGPPGVGRVAHQHFRGPLPYTLKARVEIVRYEPPRLIESRAVGDLSGTAIWTITPRNGGSRVRFDWTTTADRPLLRYLSPVLRPLFRWNHNWAAMRAMEGLEPYVQSRERRGVGRGADG